RLCAQREELAARVAQSPRQAAEWAKYARPEDARTIEAVVGDVERRHKELFTLMTLGGFGLALAFGIFGSVYVRLWGVSGRDIWLFFPGIPIAVCAVIGVIGVIGLLAGKSAPGHGPSSDA
ncbi:MAG: hypothetical protein ACOC8A_02005, partial [bacterium]